MLRKIEKAEPLGSIPKSARESKPGDCLFTPKEAADFLRVSLSWLAKARMRGDGPSTRLNQAPAVANLVRA